MGNYWNLPGVPHKGWTLVDVIDVREDGADEWEADYETCMMWQGKDPVCSYCRA
jgi:hypothetical protein